MWLPSTENSISRSPNLPSAASKHDAIAPKHRRLRRFHTWRRTRTVTWTGVALSNRGRARCETSGFLPFGLRPAPRRLPPCCGSFNDS